MSQIWNKEELDHCNFVKAVLMLLVVLQHSMALYTGAWGPFAPAQNSVLFDTLSAYISSFHIYGFVLVSGYVFYYIKYERGGGYNLYLPFIINKAKRLLVPFIFVAIIWVIPINLYFFPEESIVDKFLLGSSPRQLWFLLMLFWVFVFFWPMANLVNRRPLVGGVIVAALYGIGILLPSYFCVDRGMQYLIFFYIGFLIRKERKINGFLYKMPGFVYILVHLLLFAANKVLGSHAGMFFKLATIGSGVLLHIVGAIGAFVLLQKLANCKIAKIKPTEVLAKHGFTIYLFHQQIIYFCIMLTNDNIPPVGVVAVNFIISMSVSVLVSILLSKSRITNFLIGNKNA